MLSDLARIRRLPLRRLHGLRRVRPVRPGRLSNFLTADRARNEYVESVATVPLLFNDDFGMRKLPDTAAEDCASLSIGCCTWIMCSSTAPELAHEIGGGEFSIITC
jgi:hypothetical protein